MRFGLKVLKAKSDKDNWTYVPKSEANVLDAALKIFGKKAFDQCQWIVWSPEKLDKEVTSSLGGDSSLPKHSESMYRLEAMFPKPDGCESILRILTSGIDRTQWILLQSVTLANISLWIRGLCHVPGAL